MVIVIVGPTAVGKTKMSVELAKALNGEIINADSTQVYKGLDIATAKITEEEKENIPHYLFDFKEITEDYTVYDYQKDCRKKIEEILKKGKTPILVGGTGLYIKAALYDYQFVDGTCNEQYDNVETSILFSKLLEIDPNTKIHPNNRKRIIRAINFFQETGEIPSSKIKTDNLLYPCQFIGLTCDRDILYERINRRTDIMVEQGLLEEAQKLFDSKIRSKSVLTPIGYKELFPYFEGTYSLEQAIEIIKKNCRKYAKRQYTWFHHQIPVKWFSVNFEDFEKTIQEVLSFCCES
ncbi:MAG: tRNA (adenosine(37)-N6)-dimethylallyltransferase MiaA [Bacilli bacterium]|nr:tRNA (adenosine(37)-N6)-dimethylallyltransferase MiaA [Bacilli bacterium]